MKDMLISLIVYMSYTSQCTHISKHQVVHPICVCVCVCVCICVSVCMLNHFSNVQLFLTLWTAASQVPLFIGIIQVRILECFSMPSSRGSSWQRNRTYISCFLYWQAGSLPLATPGKPIYIWMCAYIYIYIYIY